MTGPHRTPPTAGPAHPERVHLPTHPRDTTQPGHPDHPHPLVHHAALTGGEGLKAGDLLYLSAMTLATLWAVVLLFVVYPQSPVNAGFADDDVPVMSLQGNVVTVKRARLEEALASGQYLHASREQVEYFEERRAATRRDVKRDKLFWFMAAATAPGLGLLLFRLWYRAQRKG
jgi:hypothetical protein